MRPLTLLLIPLLFLSSCSIDWNDEKDKKIAELEKQVTELKQKNDDEGFKKNLECNNLSDDISKFGKEFYGDKTQIRNIFYSPKRKSCLFIAWSDRSINSKDIYVISIMDYLTKESLYGFDSESIFVYQQVINNNCSELVEKCSAFNKKLQEFK